MKHSLAKHLAVLALGLAGAFLVPSNGNADYYPWGGWGWGGSPYVAGYYPGYSSGYFPSYWGGYYGGPYLDGYYTGYFPSYLGGCYGSGCCGGCGSACCSTGCGSCGVGCGSCGLGCGSCGLGCGSCGAGFACMDGCGCGAPACGCGLACGSGCGVGAPTGTGPACGGTAPPGPPPKKPAATSDDNFQPRSYEPAPTRPRKAPANPPEPGTGGPAAGNELPPNEPSGPGFKRGQGNDQGSPAASKGQAGDSAEFKTPASPKGQNNSPSGDSQPFGANKPVSPSPKQPAVKKAPVKNPDSAWTEGGNPALSLQERPTWSYAAPHHFSTLHLARLTVSATPERLKSEPIERTVNPVEANVARN